MRFCRFQADMFRSFWPRLSVSKTDGLLFVQSNATSSQTKSASVVDRAVRQGAGFVQGPTRLAALDSQSVLRKVKSEDQS